MSKQIYLLDKYKEETKDWGQYSVMSPFITKAKELIKPGAGARDFSFTPSGMGRTKIGEKLFGGENPLEFYNKSMTTSSQALRRELLIREFFHQSKKEWEPRRSKASWLEPGSKSDKLFEAWKNGETGYPLIDASMTQLAYEGWMPNRARMACASFLTKNMGVWWLKGERYFAKKLVDYNFDSNVGNWQWVSGVGFNARLTDVMSPELQQKKFDRDFKYCKPWLLNKLSTDGSYSVPVLVDYQKSKESYLKSL